MLEHLLDYPLTLSKGECTQLSDIPAKHDKCEKPAAHIAACFHGEQTNFRHMVRAGNIQKLTDLIPILLPCSLDPIVTSGPP